MESQNTIYVKKIETITKERNLYEQSMECFKKMQNTNEELTKKDQFKKEQLIRETNELAHSLTNLKSENLK